MDIDLTFTVDADLPPQAASAVALIGYVAGIVNELLVIDPSLTADQAAERVGNAVRSAWPTAS